MSIQQPQYPVNYAAAARRHLKDALILKAEQQQANAGQLFGICVECGIKCLLLACGVDRDVNVGNHIGDGGIKAKHKLRTHFPDLRDRLLQFGNLVPDAAMLQSYMVNLYHLDKLGDWRIDHRYHDEGHLPLDSLPLWELAAKEIREMLDELETAGHI